MILGVAWSFTLHSKEIKDIVRSGRATSVMAALSTQESRDIKAHKEVVSIYEKQKKEAESDLASLYDDQLGGIAKADGIPLELPDDFKKTTARTMSDGIKLYLKGKVPQYYIVLAYLDYVIDSYNELDGTYWSPLSIESEFAIVPENLRAT